MWTVGAALTLLLAAGTTAYARSERPVLSFPYLNDHQAKLEGYRSLAARVARSYVQVVLMNKGRPVYRDRAGVVSTASGVIIDADNGYIVTAAHIARSPSYSASITTWDGRHYDARILNVLPGEDLALLKTDRIAGGRSVRLANSAILKPGDFVLAIGTPKHKMGVVTLGRIRLRNIGQRLDYGKWGFDNAIEIAMTVEVGHSGGPVFDASGNLIGMVAGYERRSVTKTGYGMPSITYVVPSNGIRSFLRRSIAGYRR